MCSVGWFATRSHVTSPFVWSFASAGLARTRLPAIVASVATRARLWLLIEPPVWVVVHLGGRNRSGGQKIG
jgi:hypothetical protein